MPTEYKRKRARKLIKLPSGDTMYVPVITEIGFLDSVDRAQETFFTPRNDSTGSRTVHVDDVHPTPGVDVDGRAPEGAQVDTSTTLKVERIDNWPVLDTVERAQETRSTLDNTTGNDSAPPHFSTHTKTHIYRYFKNPQSPDDQGTWIDSELIDEFRVLDHVDRAQETRYVLNNPTNDQFRAGDLSGQADPNDPDITGGDGSGEGTTDTPVRLDPFQNIVNFRGGYFFVVKWGWADYTYGNIEGVGTWDTTYQEICDSTPKVVTRIYNGTLTPHDAVEGTDVPNDSTVTFPNSPPQASVVWLNPGLHTEESHAPGRAGVVGPPPATSYSATVPPDDVPAAPFDFFVGGPPSPLFFVGDPVNSYLETFYFQSAGGADVDTTDQTNLIGDIEFDLSVTSKTVSTINGSVSYPASFSFHFCPPPSDEFDTSSYDRGSIINGAPGFGVLTIDVYSVSDVHWDESQQKLVANKPGPFPHGPLPDPLSRTDASGFLEIFTTELGDGTCSTAWGSGPSILRLAIKKIPDPDNPGKQISVPIVWVKSPLPFTTYGTPTPTIPFGNYRWTRTFGLSQTFSDPIGFGTPPP